MENWNKLSTSLASLNLGQSASKIAKGLNMNVQAAKERFGQVSVDELTELPPGRSLPSSLASKPVNYTLTTTRPCRVQRA